MQVHNLLAQGLVFESLIHKSCNLNRPSALPSLQMLKHAQVVDKQLMGSRKYEWRLRVKGLC